MKLITLFFLLALTFLFFLFIISSFDKNEYSDSQLLDICEETKGTIVPINSEDAQVAQDVICSQKDCCIK